MTFTDVVCGIDPTGESLEAARQGARLAPPDAPLVLVTGVEPMLVSPSMGLAGDQWAIPTYDPDLFEALEKEALRNLERAQAEVHGLHPAEVKVVSGSPGDALLMEIEGKERPLIALGVHEKSRVLGMLGGSVATSLVHSAPCSVLLARPPADAERFPASIVVGSDGSEPSLTAVSMARDLAAAHGSGLVVVVAGVPQGKRAAEVERADADEVRQAVARLDPELEVVEDYRDPVDALRRYDAALIVVGHRGRTGLRSLGSVSERLAHKASCSVLVVR